MRRFVSRAFLATFLVASVAGCASGGPAAGVPIDGDHGGRLLVMIPPLEGPNGARVANELRVLVMGSTTHAPLLQADVTTRMADYGVETLGEIEARQLAQLMNVPLVSWGAVREAAGGLQVDIKFVDTRRGDEIVLNGLSGATPQELAAQIYTGFERQVEGIRLAAACTDALQVGPDNAQTALTSCEAALAIIPGSISGLLGKATSLLYLQRFEDALPVYDQLLAVDPANQEAMLGAGLAASRIRDRERALSYYGRYLDINPGDPQIRINVATDIAQAGGDYVSAFRVLEPAMAENAQNGAFQSEIFQTGSVAGQSLLQEGDTATAREILGKALQAYDRAYGSSTQVEAAPTQRYIEALNGMGRNADALQQGQAATSRFPNEAGIWQAYANALSTAGRTVDEIQALSRVVDLGAATPAVYARRAQAYERNAQRAEAVADAVKLSESQAPLAANLLYAWGLASVNTRDWASAAMALEPAQPIAPAAIKTNLDFYLGLSLLYQAQTIAVANQQALVVEQLEQAVVLLEKSIPFLQGSGHANAPATITAAEQLLANQMAQLERRR